jgi:hypothetical protein
MSGQSLLTTLGIDASAAGACWGEWLDTTGAELVSVNPSTEEPLGSVKAPRIPE